MRRMGCLPVSLLLMTLLSACSAFQSGEDSLATQVAADVVATQTAMAPTPVPAFEAATINLRVTDELSLEEAMRYAPDGATITLGPGTYRLSERVNIRRSLRLVGAGMSQTEVVSTAEGYAIRFSGDGPFALEGITFRHAGGASASLVAVWGGEVIITRCRFTGAQAAEEYVERAGLWLSRETIGVVQDCVIGDGSVGIYVDERAQPTLERNQCTGNTMAGIVYWGSAGGLARQNMCTGNQVGIVVGKRSQPLLEDNVCADNEITGISYAGDAGGTARRNECNRNGALGIAVNGGAQPALEDNTCFGNEVGIGVGEQASATLEGNTCSENGSAGIGFMGSAGGAARENECSRNEFGITVMEQAMPTLEENACNENRVAGISYSDSGGGVANENECVGNGLYGISVAVTSNPSLVGNDCHDNGRADIEYLNP